MTRCTGCSSCQMPSTAPRRSIGNAVADSLPHHLEDPSSSSAAITLRAVTRSLELRWTIWPKTALGQGMLHSITPCSDHMIHPAHSTTLISSASTVKGNALRSLLSLNETSTDESNCDSESLVHLEAMSGHVTGPLHEHGIRELVHLLESFVGCHHGNV